MRNRSVELLVGLLAASAAVAELPVSDPRPGGIAVVALGATEVTPSVRFGEDPVLIMHDGGQWHAVVGIPLGRETGRASVTVTVDDRDREIAFEVVPHQYREQRLTVERSYVEPDQTQLERIFAERRIIDAALSNHRDQDVESLALPAPVPGRQSPSFGFRRFFNDQPRSPHSGMDITANQGTEIVAPKAGIVTATGGYFFNGNTVILDHGQGFVTMYCHLHRIDVEEGQSIEPGDVLGLVGATGRVTGAHLHFGTYLTGTAVDPAIFLIEQ